MLWRKGNPGALLVGMQTGAASVENSMELPQKLKMELPFDLAIPLLGLYPKNPETPIKQNLCTPMLIAAQFTVAKCWKEPRCPLVNEWINKLWFYTQWNTMKQKERRSSYPLRQHGWKWRALC